MRWFRRAPAAFPGLLEDEVEVDRGSGGQPRGRGRYDLGLDVSDVAGHPHPRDGGRAAAVLQVLYSAASWEFLRNFWDMDATEAADAIDLGIRSLLTGLRLHVDSDTVSQRTTSHQQGEEP